MHGEKVGGGGGGKLLRSAKAYKRCLNLINAFLVKKRLFYNGKHVFPVNGLCLETKQMWLKSCVARNGDPCLKPRLFSQPQIFFQPFCFHEIRLTDKLL